MTEEQYEQAVQNLKRDSYKKQFDYYSSLFSGAIQALQQAEMDQVDANMMRKLRQPKVIRKKWNVWKMKRPKKA